MVSQLQTKRYLKLFLSFILITLVIILSGTGYVFTKPSLEYNEVKRHSLRPQKSAEKSVNETESLWKSVRVLCLILTSKTGQAKMAAVNETWASKCDKKYFLFSREINKTDNAEMLFLPVKEGRAHLTAKVRYALKYAYEKHRNEFDWFLKCDDDTYIIMENLRHLLASTDHNKPSYMGFHMKLFVKNGFMSGGGGYVISSRALHDVVRIGFENGSCKIDGHGEDVEIGKCLQGPMCCSRYSVTFHYVRPEDMYNFHHLLYHTEVLGNLRPPVPDTIFNLQPVNPPP
ncbi:C1GLT-like protein [Mya arenaria]|uniref:N-acetylgalactosaminide beta-1,3-galactosyltransferase n=1 Tax=Mya arenaria TaxID=6604 RepID=A0ABY7DBC4_MYAAR|nr:C1GLT-like protein [Mya arenaria]